MQHQRSLGRILLFHYWITWFSIFYGILSLDYCWSLRTSIFFSKPILEVFHSCFPRNVRLRPWNPMITVKPLLIPKKSSPESCWQEVFSFKEHDHKTYDNRKEFQEPDVCFLILGCKCQARSMDLWIIFIEAVITGFLTFISGFLRFET